MAKLRFMVFNEAQKSDVIDNQPSILNNYNNILEGDFWIVLTGTD